MPSLSGLSMAQEENEHSLEAKFTAAVQVIRSLPEEGPFQPSDDMMLMFYSYYKQATMGPCNIPRPIGFWDTRGKAKWDAWSSLGNMTKEEAMKNYIEHIQLILETIPISEEVSELVQKLGNFYTEVDGEEEDNEADKRPFTRPFAGHSEELVQSIEKPRMEGFGDLWDDIQNIQEKDKDSSVRGLSVSSEEAEESKDGSEIERKEERCVWRRSEEEEYWDDSVNTVDEDKEEERVWFSGPGWSQLFVQSLSLSELPSLQRTTAYRKAGSDRVLRADIWSVNKLQDWSPDPRFLMVDDKRWRSDTKGSSSSLEPSMSSFTNGTHSSLNSEVEEEELACSIELGVQCNSYMHINGHISEPSDADCERNHRPADSDNEEFCDSMEHLAMEEQLSKGRSPGSGAASVRPSDLWFESNATLKETEDEVFIRDFYVTKGAGLSKHSSSLSRRIPGSLSPKITSSSPRCVSVSPTCGCVSKSRLPVTVTRRNINEQIATALLRLQRDMADVLHRLHALEERTRSQSRSSSQRQEDFLLGARKFLRPSWWPFDFSPLTVVLSALWPLVTHWLVQLYLQRRRRKIP